jgi:pyrroloquinoline quinone (PQQ) biosynthesis protein C
MGHQEWILNDIAALGEDKEAVRYGTPNIETELMVSYAWDTIQRRNPVGFFGMVLVLEGTSVELAVRAADAIETTLELPKEAFSYLRSHGSLDIEHVDFYERLMNRLELVEDQNAIIHCAKVMYRLYGGIFRSLS